MRLLCSVFAAAVLALAASAGNAQPQQGTGTAAADMLRVPDWLVGTWTLVRCDNVYPDGHRVELYGPHPQGLWMIDAHGHYMMQMVRAGRAPFAAGDKSKGTPEEYRAASLDSNAHFGSVAVMDKQMRTHIEQASFPNWNGHGGSTGYTLDGNQLTYIVAKPSSGAAEGAHGEVVWQKLD
ncbi:lipocalin-like domain-containing protein [Dyella acidiphila]|uniref:Lipocalin-like domain-containing protein n=1 Tax=Dyella acidiphila TaxID=2775866 RepID=A0ABR9G660_9GAMM|nr:lipocalin-like domain-containing protein [Dyella acidiphila]MBE1159530.1 lipocalin-like domain-containing protein [Dyella acidiphila]